jgi:two-component system, LuxR family, response regulator FixJ
MLAALRPPMPSATVCLIDADPAVRARLAALVTPLGLGLESHASPAEFFAWLDRAMAERDARLPVCLVSEAAATGDNGLALLAELQRRGLDLPTILITEEADISAAVRAMRAGALDFIEKAYLERAVVAQLHALRAARD